MNEDRESTIYTTCVYFTCQVIKMFSICRLLVRNVSIMQYATDTQTYIYIYIMIQFLQLLLIVLFLVSWLLLLLLL